MPSRAALGAVDSGGRVAAWLLLPAPEASALCEGRGTAGMPVGIAKGAPMPGGGGM
jgi:hypothetical protein